MTDRDDLIRGQLVELICSVSYGQGSLIGKNFQLGFIERIADHLLANGVTILADANVGPKWIPVEERLPECDITVLCRYVYGRHKDRAFYQALDYYASDPRPRFQFEGFRDLRVTHWMPLPEPPEG